MKINTPFDVEYTIRFSGRTQSNGKKTTTAQMIRDKICYMLDGFVVEGLLRDYHSTVQKNMIKEARATIKKSKRP